MRCALFDDLDDEHVRALLVQARRRRFARGDVVFHEGDLGDSVHLVDRGHLAIRVTTPAGDVATLRIIRAGDHFGDLAVLSGSRRSATVAALERSETIEIPGHAIRDLCDRHREFERAIARAVMHQFRSQSTQLLEAMYLPAPRRLARRLVDLCDHYGSVEIPLTQDDLAGISGTSRQTVNQVLMQWRDDGVVEVARGKVTVVDRPQLERSR